MKPMSIKEAIAFLKKHQWTATGLTGGLLTFLLTRVKSFAPLQNPLSYINSATRDKWYGPIQYRSDPVPSNPEKIVITNDFAAKNIVRRTMPIIGTIDINKKAAESLYRALTEIERRGWGYKIRSFDGSWVPRFVRKSQDNLSSHSYGTAIDINAYDNPQGGFPTPDQQDLAPIFEKNGWYWGNRFSNLDPMHFEYVVPGIV